MENLNIILNPWGSIASIAGLLITVIIFSIKLIKRYKLSKEEQENTFNEIQSSIEELASNATTATKRQDVFIYANETLGRGRHLELRMRIIATSVYMISFVTFWISILVLTFLDLGILLSIIIISLNATTIVGTIMLGRALSGMSKLNDSFSKGYIYAVNQHIKKST